MAKYVIVGNGVTGTRAAEEIRRADESADVTILTEEPYPFYRRPQLADFASGEVAEARMWARKSSFYEDNSLDLRLSTKVVSVDVGAHTVTLADGGSVSYDRLLVATGRDVTSGGLRGGDAAGINHFKTLGEAKSIRELDGAGRSGVVFGNGMVALELVRALTTSGFSTTYLVPTESLWPEVLDEYAADIVLSRLHAAGAEVAFGARLASVESSGGCAGEAVLENGDVVSADVIGMCSGYVPAVGFLPDGGVGLNAGPGFTTPWSDVLVAGDVTVDPATNYFNWLRSWRQGSSAGAAMVGNSDTEEQAAINTLNTQVLGLGLVALGRTIAPYRSGYSEMRGDYPYAEFYKKLVFSSGDVLVGALLLGNVAEAAALEQAIRAGTKKADLPEELLHQMFDITYRAAYKGVQCPVCRHEIQLAKGAAVGDLVTCPVCGTDFNLVQGDVGFKARIAG